MRIIMMGTGPFAVPTFESLLDSDHELPLLVTRPTPPTRSRSKPPPNPMREFAESRGVEVFAPKDINSAEAAEKLTSLNADLFVVCDYGQILSNDALSIPPLGGINLHGSILPKYRGAAPVHWAIMNGDDESGITVIHMTPKLDGGPVLTVRTTPIGSDETTEQLEPRLALLGVEAVHEAIAMLESWDKESLIGTKQDQSLASRAPRLKKTDGAVDWSQSATQIYNKFRALKPWPGSFTQWERPNGQKLRLILDDMRVSESWQPDGSAPGSVLVAEGSNFEVATGDGVIRVSKVQPAGKRVMAVDEFLRGHSIPIGECFDESR